MRFNSKTSTGAFVLAIAAVGMAAAAPAANASLVGLYRFTNTGSLGVDSSTQANTLTPFNGAASAATGKYGTGLTLDGVDDVLGLPNGAVPSDTTLPTNYPTGNSSYALAAWIQPAPRTAQNYGIMGWGTYGTGRKVNAFRLDQTSDVQVQNYWWGADLVKNGTVNLYDGNYHHVAATYDGTTRTLYVDGANIGSDTPGGTNDATAANFRIGRTFGSEFFKGNMDDVAIFNQTLTQAQVQTIATGDFTAFGVPEPATGGAFCALAMGLLTRRRKARRQA